MSSTIDVDRNLLFAVIALQDDLIDQAQFADVCAGWAVRLERSLPELLIERGWINEQDRAEIERKLARKMKKHKGDVRATLGAVADIEARDVLQVIDNPRVRQSIGGLAPARGHVLVETLVPRANEREMLRYTLTRLHAEGGLGKIWVAHDTDLNRDVALKEIKPTTAPSPESWRRFLKEAQITGQLEHPNIVPVYELSRRKEDDQPFYTMRFVRGQSLRDAIAEFHRRRARKPAERLELQRQLLEPFIKVCQAVGYAHSRGVIHRDLKPENVVLGGYGEVVVLDWGLAKIVGQPDAEGTETAEPRVTLSVEAQATHTQGQIGTPVYMAPEQVEARPGQVDTRTDVYGLGAILFEILTGSPPAVGTTLSEIFRNIQSGNMPRARELEPTVPRALEAVCGKALEHEPRKRYRRPEDLAEDVRRWIVDEPVSVYQDPLAVRLMRWGRRHRTLVASLAALLATAVIGLATGVVLIDKERARTEVQRKIAVEQRQIAESERKVAETQRQIAVDNAAQALRNQRLAQDAADGLLGEVADVDLAEIPQMEPVRQRLLEKARAGYQQFLAQKGDDPLVRWGAERSVVRLGDIQALMGEAPKAESSYRQAIAGLNELVKKDQANADFRRDLARAEQGLGVLLKDANRYEQSDAALREAIRLREEIARGPGTSADDRQALADSRYQLGALLARRGVGKTGEAAYAAALEAQQQLVAQYGNRPEYATRLARYRNNLGMLQDASGHSQDAEATFRATLDSLAPLAQGPDALPGARWQFARVANNLGALLLYRRGNEADVQFRRARDMLAKLAAEFPAIAQYQRELAAVEYNLGFSAQRAGRNEEAVAFYKESARRLEPLASKFRETPAYRLKLGMAQAAIGEGLAKSAPSEAVTALSKALDQEAALLAEYPDVPEYQSVLGRHHYQVARLHLARNQATYEPAKALHHAEEAQKLLKAVLKSRPESDTELRMLVEDQVVMTLALIDLGRLRDASTVAGQIPATRPADVAACCHAATLLVKCAQAAPATPEGKELGEASLGRAVGVLGDAVRAKLIRSTAPLDMPELGPLRERSDFKALRESVGEPEKAR
jgi:serine/threonine protein kinase/tetratricopeptide (TPR) repeat protein